MPVQLDDAGGAALKRIRGAGVGTCRVPPRNHRRRAIRLPHGLPDGEFLETDLIVFSAGIRPQDAPGP